MSQKTDIVDMLEQDKSYDEIEDRTGSKRSYIRSIAVNYRKRDKESELPKTKDEPENTPEERPSMNFIEDKPPKTPSETQAGSKTGGKQHKAWVKAAKYECGNCGATIGKSQDFCAHCGKTLEWKGIE